MGTAGTDVAIESADIALMSDDFENPQSYSIVPKTLSNICQNAVIALLTVGALLFVRSDHFSWD